MCLAGPYPADQSRIGGGLDYAVYMLAQTLAERDDIELHIIAPVRTATPVKHTKTGNADLWVVGVRKSLLAPNIVAQVRPLSQTMRLIRPDIVLSHYTPCTLAAKEAGLPVIHTMHGMIKREIPYRSWLQKPPAHLAVHYAHKALLASDAVASVARYALDDDAKFIRVPTYHVNLAVEDVFFNSRRAAGASNLLFAGGVKKLKNLETAIRALPIIGANYPHARLIVCGGVRDKKYFQFVEALAKNLKVAHLIQWEGLVDRDKLSKLLSGSAALLVTSYQESTPTVICQAMAMGVVPVGSGVGGIPEMIDDGKTGFLIEPEDHKRLAEVATSLLSDPEKTERIGEHARSVALSRYERHKVAESYLSICRDVVGSRK
ncbi:MAG: glycosyltransferase family 4 protein [Candidatus Marsarchaeota archaeon]|nr:glycosyltransferase family 4 protein [Candidatus Marsarchaeota archaeon]